MLWVNRHENDADGPVDLKQPPVAERDACYIRRGNSSIRSAELHFPQLIGILWRRRSLVLSIAAIGTILAAVVGLLIAPKYTAMAQLIVQPQVDMLKERTPGTSLMEESIDTHVTLLSSRDHLQRVVESLSKDLHSSRSANNLPEHDATPSPSDDVRRSVAADDPAAASATEATTLNEFKRRLSVWIDELRGKGKTAVPSLIEFERSTQVNQERRSRIISVAFTSASPTRAAAFANRIVQCYISGLIDQKATSAELVRLEERIAEAKSEMERAELAVQKAVQQRWRTEQSANSEGWEPGGKLHELERHVGAAAQFYNNLLQRRTAMRDQQQTVSPGIEIYSLASAPNHPSSHNPILFILPAFFFFAIGGSWLAVVLEQLDRGLRSEREISEALGIGCIGLIPRLAARYATRPDQYLRKKSFSPYTEAIRSTVAALQLTCRAPASKVILVTSSVPREGKTTLARSLAACVAQFGRRVLLLDLDFRQQSPFGALASGAESAIIAPQTQNPLAAQVIHLEVGLDYLSVPRCRFDMLAFLAGEQTLGFTHQLYESYDCVIIDGPPLLGIAEARLLPSIADKLLLVVKWGSTRSDIVKNALNLVRDSCSLEESYNGKQFAVITQVDLEKHAQYRYGDVGESLVKHRKYFNCSLQA